MSLPTERQSPLRIAFVGTRGIPARYGGFETFVQELAPRLVARGLDVSVFCEASQGPAPTRQDGVRLEYVPARGPGGLATLSYDFASLWRTRRAYDLVYMCGYGASLACWLPRLWGTRVWINMDGVEWRRSKWGPATRLWLRTMERIAGWAADHLVFDNRALAQEVSARLGARCEWSVLEYGARVQREADPAPLAALDLDPGCFDLSVCRAEPENHLVELIRAHARAGNDRPLAIVANSDQDNAYCREVQRVAGDGTRLLGPIYEAEVLDALRVHCHTYLHGHSVGGTNPALIEAMGCGALVVAHDNPFNREVLTDAGRYFADERGLVTALRELEHMDAPGRQALRNAARARIRSRYGWEDLADRYAAALRGELGTAARKAVA